MSFIAKNPLVAPTTDNTPPTPPKGTMGIFPTQDGWKQIDDEGNITDIGSNNNSSIIVDQTYNPESENAQSGKAIAEVLNTKADKTEIPTKLSELDNDGGYVKNTDYATNNKAGLLRVAYGYGTQISSDGFLTIARCSKAEIYERTNSTHPVTPDVLEYAVKSVGDGYYAKEPIVIVDTESTEYNINFLERHNHIMRLGELINLSFTFGNGEYADDYALELSFDSGATPTAIDYTDSGILNWVGTDCTTSDGLSIFQPSPNTHYDIVFYYNGNQFIGLVNGYVPASGNVVSE